MGLGLMWGRVSRNAVRASNAQVGWLTCVVKLLTRWFAEGRTLAVELRRREWGRLGGKLKTHKWVKKYRNANFFPVFDTRVVKRWLEKPGGRRMLY